MDLEAVLTDTPYKSRLDIIKKHSEVVWERGTVHHTHYTLHGMDHSRAVISVLNKLVDGIDPDNGLTIHEIFYLLASVYLHDVGMLISHSDDDDRAEVISAQRKRPYTKEDLIRDEHHLRSGKYVIEHAGDLTLDHVESVCVKLVCEGHRVVKLDAEGYSDRLVGNERIRVRSLAALLRFSDELDISYQRAPTKLMDVLKEDMPDYSRLQWLKHYYTSGIGISVRESNGMRKTIVEIQAQHPDRELGRKITDELIFKPIERSLNSVDRILLECGLNIRLNPPEIHFNENLDKIPEDIYNKYLCASDEIHAWQDLIRLTRDKDRYVRWSAAIALGSAFPHLPDKNQAWQDLIRLTRDRGEYVRASANHSLGRASIFKATETGNEKDFCKEIKNAIEFFDRSSKETTYFNPSRFCLPFYRSFYMIMFEEALTEDEVQKYLAEAKRASEGFDSAETLFEVVENLANALTESRKAGGMDFDTMKSDLNAYRQYCERAADLIGSAEGMTAGAAGVLRRGLPIIDQRIKELLEEVKMKSERVCKTAGISESELGHRIKQHAAAALATDNPVIVDKTIGRILSDFEIWSHSILDEHDKKYIQGIILNASDEDVRGKLSVIRSLLVSALARSKTGEEEMPMYETTEPIVQIAEGNVINQKMDQPVNLQKELSRNNAETDTTSKKEEQPEPTTVPYLSDLESEICDIFKSVYQKERKADASEVNSKTLEFLKYKLLDLTASGKEINWLDVGCGAGRCLDVLDAVQNRGNIRYHGTDISYKYFDDTEERARKYNLNPRLDKIDTAAMEFDSEYDVVSAVLLLHEVNPLCLPYILRNMLRALKSDGTLVIVDFQGPYEQEAGVVAWGAEDIRNLLEKIGEAKMSIEFMPSSQYPDELGFYRCYVKKPGLDREKFSNLLQGYDNFLDAKKEESKRKRGELRSQIEERVQKLLNRPDIDLKNISEGEMQRIQTEIGGEYGIKAHKIRLLTSQIEFLDDKIKEFNSGVGCAGADRRTP